MSPPIHHHKEPKSKTPGRRPEAVAVADDDELDDGPKALTPRAPATGQPPEVRTIVEQGVTAMLCPACASKIELRGVPHAWREGSKRLLTTENTVGCGHCGVRFTVRDSKAIFL